MQLPLYTPEDKYRKGRPQRTAPDYVLAHAMKKIAWPALP